MQINETKKDSKIVNIVIFLFYLVIPPVGCAAVMFFLKGQATDLIFFGLRCTGHYCFLA